MFVLPCVVTTDGQVDGIPNVVPEAMAMQLPVICSDLAAIRELVTSGVDGILVPAGDVTTLADAMAGLLDDPEWREALGRRGRQTVLEQFDVEVNVRRLVEELWPDRIAVDANPAIEVAG
jgi:glycosyltransferase involved in cell wall biosynthesis